MDDFPSLRSLEGIGRSLGTERPSFSPPRENELTQPSGARDAALRERSEPRFEERFEARVEEAERRVRGERTRSDEDERRVEARDEGESTSQNTEPKSRSTDGRARSNDSETSEAALAKETESAEAQANEALVSLRFAGAEVAAPLATLGQTTPNTNGTALTSPEPGALQAFAAPLGVTPGAPSLDYGTVSQSEPSGPLGGLATTTLTGGQTGQGGDASFTGGEQPGSAQTATAAGSSTPGAAEAFGTLLTTEITGDKPDQAVRPETGTRTLPPSQREIELAGDVLKQFRMQLQPGLNEATIHLRPTHLGRVAIRLSVEDGRLRATLRAEKTETLGILENHLPELRAALEGQGFEAQEFDLGLGDSESSGFEEFFAQDDSSAANASVSRQNQEALLEESERVRNVLQQRLDSDNPSVDTYA